LWPAEKRQLCFSGPRAESRTGAENFDSGNAAAALGGKSGGTRAVEAASARYADLGQHDGHTIRAAPDSALVFILQRANGTRAAGNLRFTTGGPSGTLPWRSDRASGVGRK